MRVEKEDAKAKLVEKETEFSGFRKSAQKQTDELRHTCQVEVSTVKQELQDLINDNDRLKEEVLAKDNAIEDIKVLMEMQRSDLEARIRSLDQVENGLQNEVEDVNRKLEAKTLEFDHAVAACARATDEVSKLTCQVDEFKLENEQLRNSLIEAEQRQTKELEVLQQSARDDLTTEQRKIEKTREEIELFYLSRQKMIDQHKRELEEANSVAARFEQECSILREDVERSRAVIKEREHQVATLESEINSKSNRMKELNAEMNAMLKDEPDESAPEIGEESSTPDYISRLQMQVWLGLICFLFSFPLFCFFFEMF